MLSRYVKVILPVPVGETFTYSIPETIGEEVTVGSRVIVPFGKKKYYTGIVSEFAPTAPAVYTIKDIVHVLDGGAVVRHPQLRFWEWMAQYYMCSIGDVYRAAVPSGLKIESETQFEVNPDYEPAEVATLPEREAIVYNTLSAKGRLALKDIERLTGFKSVTVLTQRLCTRGAIVVSESLVARYRPKREQYVRMAIAHGDDAALKETFDKVHSAPKQEKMLMTLLQLTGFTNKGRKPEEVKVSQLIEKSGLTTTILKALVDKGIAERYTVETSRFRYAGGQNQGLPTLSEAQARAVREIHNAGSSHAVTLLHGVTSSGKTEVYMHLIDYMLSQGRQVLYLVPEIALTTQLTQRLQAVFGDRLVIYHSKFTDAERVEIWQKMMHSVEPMVVLGVRSSVFLPFGKLGLVIVDEEHDQQYKQFDPAPRFNGRDAAIMLAHMHGAATVLGSATPSVETYYKASSGKYGLVSLTERYGGIEPPEIRIVNMAQEKRAKQVKGSLALSTIASVREAVGEGKQAIVFHNRRGFAPMAHCTQCQYIPKCDHCDVSLTYHKHANMLVCHYCGSTYPLPQTCPVCKGPTIEVVGYGTERIEDEVEEAFPEAKVLRMDLDTTRNKNSYESLINAFSSHKADILVGTQMVTKGLDFGDVAVAAVINADSVLNYPDFRSAEHAYNMLEQVSGRAGRRDMRGEVLIQTRTPEHPVIGFVKAHDYQGFYQYEIEERRMYAYPPYARLIYVHIKHRDPAIADFVSEAYASRLRTLLGTRVNGPVRPGISRIQSMHIRQVLIKVEPEASIGKVKEILRELHVQMHTQMPEMRSTLIVYDVDPY